MYIDKIITPTFFFLFLKSKFKTNVSEALVSFLSKERKKKTERKKLAKAYLQFTLQQTNKITYLICHLWAWLSLVLYSDHLYNKNKMGISLEILNLIMEKVSGMKIMCSELTVHNMKLVNRVQIPAETICVHCANDHEKGKYSLLSPVMC